MGIVDNALIGASGQSGYNLQRSVRLRASASAYLNKTFSTSGTGAGKTWTFSAWVKRGVLGSASGVFDAYNTTGPSTDSIGFRSDDTFTIYFANAGGGNLTTTQVFRDPSAWYHILVALDTTQATASNRCKIYINGSQVTAFGTANYPSQNAIFNWGNTQANNIGRKASAVEYFDGYLTEVNFIDGQALTPASFGSTNARTGVWQPAKYTGTYGTNGFYLPFTDNTSATNAAIGNSGIGKDFSGNGNYWTSNNISLSGGTVQSFTSSTTWTAPAGVTSVNYLVVAGGGGGGSAATGVSMGGGGGAGGLLQGTLAVTPGNTYTVTIGSGGAATTSGGNSVFGSITATGGGAGAGGISSFTYAQNGGSGGGGGPYTGLQKGSGIAGQGYDGGSAGSLDAAAGGGGSSGVGGSISSGTVGGAGGPGTVSNITGSNVTYAGGGGGGAYLGYTGGAGGSGGGGAGGANADGANATGYGSGGGGAGQYGNTHVGGSGSSGIVVIAYGTSTTYDSMTDVPTLTSATAANFAVMNVLNGNPATGSLSDGNLTGLSSSAGEGYWNSTIAIPSSGKWYWEFQFTTGGSGIRTAVTTTSMGTYSLLLNESGRLYVNGADQGIVASGYSGTDIMGVSVDVSTTTIKWYKNNTLNYTYTYTAQSLPLFAFGGKYSNPCYFNFGQRPFSYTPPTGYVALNTYNLPTSTIVKGNTVMDATLWTGNGTSQTITNSGAMKPDLIWIKSRSVNGYYHVLTDSVRGITKALYSNATDAENTLSTRITAINSNGFSLGSSGDVNESPATFVGWQWQAGQGTTSSNTNGTITSTVSVNASAGFSVVTYTGDGANFNVGHGLGVKPSMIIVKGRSNTSDWFVYHTSMGEQNYALLNSTAAKVNNANYFRDLSSTTYGGTNSATGLNTNGVTYVAYCWTPIAGYSAFGSYTGNGSADGPFIYTGFRPKYLMLKRTDSGNSWVIEDSARNTFNVVNNYLIAEGSAAEATSSQVNIDFLSNGFKLRSGFDIVNAGSYIYIAFAENPFKNALAR